MAICRTQIYCNFRTCIFCILLDQEAWDKVLYRLISKHFWAWHQYIVVNFSSYVRQANIHVLANSHLKQGIWALKPGEDRCSISRTVLSTISQYVFLWSFLNYDQSLTYDLRLFVKPATESSKDDQLYSNCNVIWLFFLSMELFIV
jgi:hypothetical protein